MNYSIVELSSLSLSQLVQLYNVESDKPVKAFKTKPIALERLEKLAGGRAVAKHEQGTFQLETAEMRETRLAGLSVNEADQRDAAAEHAGEFDADDSGAQEHVVQPEPSAPALVAAPKRRGPAPAFADDEIIYVLKPIETARRSPKAANWARYTLYHSGMTVREYLDAAVALQGATATRWRGDLIWDHERQNIGSYSARQWANHLAGRDIEDDGE